MKTAEARNCDLGRPIFYNSNLLFYFTGQYSSTL